MTAPIWATEIVNEVCLENNREVPALKWRMKRGGSFATIGNYKKGLITISVGKDNLEKQVVLHEISHHIDIEGGHGKSFYLILRSLLIKYDCLTEEYKQREYRYRRLSLLYL